MNKINSLLLCALASVILNACGGNKDPENKSNQKDVNTPQRIVSLNGAITEIISALGHEKELVGRDVTSTYPENLSGAKDLGHVRTLTIEPIVALNPTLILASDKDLNPELTGKIQQSGINYAPLTQEFSVEGTKDLIRQVAEKVGNDDYEKLYTRIDEDMAKLQPIAEKPRVLFIYARGAGTLMVAGRNTPMESIIKIAGGVNAVDNLEDFKPLTPESLVQANPDVILMFDKGLQSLGGDDGLLKIQGMEQTNAGKKKAFISMDGALLSGFGPRVGEAALKLNQLIVECAK